MTVVVENATNKQKNTRVSDRGVECRAKLNSKWKHFCETFSFHLPSTLNIQLRAFAI